MMTGFFLSRFFFYIIKTVTCWFSNAFSNTQVTEHQR